MKKTVFLLAGLFVMACGIQSVKADGGSAQASANANATATILQAVSITKQADLQFGKIIASSTEGKVQIQTDGSRTIADGNVVLFNTESNHQAASFTASGTAERTYSLSFPASATLTREGGSETMTIEKFVHSAKGTLDASTGEETFNVGATLNVGANQAPGQYTGTFTVTAAYN